MKRILIIILILTSFLLLACNNSNEENREYVDIKYREEPVDVSNPKWEYLDTSKSSWIEEARYDKDERYMIINLQGTNYHYCDVPKSTWESFQNADSFGSDYNSYIKGNFDCRDYDVPNY